jgi:hydroxymethylbilane synthase
MNEMLVNLGSRGSKLALLQANYIKELLESTHTNLQVELQVISTSGDNIQDRPLPEIGGKGLFTAEIEAALLNHDIDLAVHSLKDLPSTLPEGLVYAGSPKREDARDVFVSNCRQTLKDIPPGGTIATGSTRRKAQLLQFRNDLNILDLRGNIDTRLRKLDEGKWDGILMAAAALHRMDLKERASQYLSPSEFVPSVGQGAIGLEIAENRKDVAQLLQPILHETTTLECTAERVFLKQLNGGCSVPIGCHARVLNAEFCIDGFLAKTDGEENIRASLKGSSDAALHLAEQLSEKFLNAGAKEVLSS